MFEVIVKTTHGMQAVLGGLATEGVASEVLLAWLSAYDGSNGTVTSIEIQRRRAN
jgi:hypothetical protein